MNDEKYPIRKISWESKTKPPIRLVFIKEHYDSHRKCVFEYWYGKDSLGNDIWMQLNCPRFYRNDRIEIEMLYVWI